jgi:hypothetical protein
MFGIVTDKDKELEALRRELKELKTEKTLILKNALFLKETKIYKSFPKPIDNIITLSRLYSDEEATR